MMILDGRKNQSLLARLLIESKNEKYAHVHRLSPNRLLMIIYGQ